MKINKKIALFFVNEKYIVSALNKKIYAGKNLQSRVIPAEVGTIISENFANLDELLNYLDEYSALSIIETAFIQTETGY
jgi:hypothetical protein